VVLHKRRWETPDSVDKLFRDTAASFEINNVLKGIEKNQTTQDLSKGFFNKCAVEKSGKASQSKKKLTGAQILTERLHKGTKAALS